MFYCQYLLFLKQQLIKVFYKKTAHINQKKTLGFQLLKVIKLIKCNIYIQGDKSRLKILEVNLLSELWLKLCQIFKGKSS